MATALWFLLRHLRQRGQYVAACLADDPAKCALSAEGGVVAPDITLLQEGLIEFPLVTAAYTFSGVTSLGEEMSFNFSWTFEMGAYAKCD